MPRYLKIISQSALVTGLLAVTLLVIGFWLWQQSRPDQVAVAPNTNLLIPPPTDIPVLNTEAPLIGLITKMDGDTLWISKWGNSYEIKLDPRIRITKTTKPSLVPPNQANKPKPALKTPVQASYLKPGQQVRVISQIISSANQPILLATNLEIWE